ncbi:MAG: adenosine kinase [Hyphomicrobiales bacterium]|nr:adenosine kinase [Hyphomicrobiales bacterium]
MNPHFDVVAMGNAIVDMIARADESFLLAQKLVKGSMSLTDEASANALYAAMGPTTEISGGSAANTVAGLASLGGRAAYIGKVKNDDAGRAFAHDIRAAGVAFKTAPAQSGPATARCMVLVTPDGERTMKVFLGASVELGPDDVDAALIEDSAILYLEGYLWDPPLAKQAFVKAAGLARAKGRRIALSLSDSFCVDRYRDEFLQLIRTRVVDIVFCNESELRSLYATADLDTALRALHAENVTGFVTRSGEGCVIVDGGQSQTVPAAPIQKLVDTTGAGDLFAAGALYGLSRGAPLRRCAEIGALAAAEIVQHFGARPETSLANLLQQSGL